MGDLSPHFSRAEFACHCGCGKMIVDLRLIDALEALRERIGRPITVISGCRCAVHNRRKGGSPNSLHLLGRAADVRVKGVSPDEVARMAEEIEAFRRGGIGRYDTFTHVDVRQHGPDRWTNATRRKSMFDPRENEVRDIVEHLKGENPNLRLFEILVPGREDEIFLARKAPWNEYKKLIGQVKSEADANELLVQKFLVHPKPDYEAMQNEWEPGLVVTLAQQIQKGMGFAGGASIKNW